jgi:hypothetical protein
MTTHALLQQLNLEMASLVDSARRSLVKVSNGHRGHGATPYDGRPRRWRGRAGACVKRFLQQALERSHA